MFGDQKDIQKNLKDSTTNLDITIKDSPFYISYTKTNKLITALYMVTDIIDKDEPLRNKLRTLGTGIISDTYSSPANSLVKISELMSFLDIAAAMNIVSLMNCNILRKEFTELNQSIKESTGMMETQNKQINLAEFFKEELPEPKQFFSKGHYQSLPVRQAGIGHQRSTSLGVQKGSTLMKALSDTNLAGVGHPTVAHNNFDILKKQRRDEIINLVQKNGGNATITDIKNGAYGSLTSCSEKTLQRELISMVKNGVLNKTGEKRWSRYYIRG